MMKPEYLALLTQLMGFFASAAASIWWLGKRWMVRDRQLMRAKESLYVEQVTNLKASQDRLEKVVYSHVETMGKHSDAMLLAAQKQTEHANQMNGLKNAVEGFAAVTNDRLTQVEGQVTQVVQIAKDVIRVTSKKKDPQSGGSDNQGR